MAGLEFEAEFSWFSVCEKQVSADGTTLIASPSSRASRKSKTPQSPASVNKSASLK
ncbi:hypothetical protein TRIUR3_16930 [Triticum urartu]|uniref:Uncharacterized protein n=1 Tax=Triticum urartu TaxID=4572 RepID=M8A8V3_TRIUA|nr:hypothetical protein TRIUR3_16930 [Triticum urartu]